MPINFVLNRRFLSIWRFYCDYQKSYGIKGLCKENGCLEKSFRTACHAKLYDGATSGAGYENIISDIRNNSGMQNYFVNYQKEFDLPR